MTVGGHESVRKTRILVEVLGGGAQQLAVGAVLVGSYEATGVR